MGKIYQKSNNYHKTSQFDHEQKTITEIISDIDSKLDELEKLDAELDEELGISHE